MSLTADNCKVVYWRLVWPTEMQVSPDILKLTAKFENKKFSVWIKPTKRIFKSSVLSRNGLEAKNGELFFRGQRLDTVDLTTALTRFCEFITSSPQPVLLVTHSSGIELALLSEAIRNTVTISMFESAIQRVVDTVPIFEKRFPSLEGGSRLTLNVLISYQKVRQLGTVLDASYQLDCLIRLLAENSISTSELIEYSEPYEKVLPSFQYPPPLYHDPLYMHDLFPLLGLYTVRKLEKASISFATLKELSQEDGPEMLHRYVEKQFAEKEVAMIQHFEMMKIFKFLKKSRPHDHGSHSVTTGQERSADEPGPSTRPHGKKYDYSFFGQQKELIDDLNSLMEEMESPYDRDYSSIRQEPQATHSFIGDQGKPIVEQRVRLDNDYASFSLEQQELITAIDSYSEGQGAVNDYPFSYQLDEATMDGNSFAEVQETPYDGTYPFTSEEEERLADANSMIEESRALYDNDHSLVGHEREREATLDYPITGQRDELINDQGHRDRELLQKWHEEFNPFY